MKILGLLNQNKISIRGLWEEIIDDNEKYRVSVLSFTAGVETAIYGTQVVQTAYVLEGQLELKLYNGSTGEKIGTEIFNQDQGWTLLPEQTQQIRAVSDCLVYLVSGKTDYSQLINKPEQNQILIDKINKLSDYVVSKPHGSEKWFVDNGIYVLKGISMNEGTECSLQLHEQKVEVNIVLKGGVKLSLGYDEEIKKMIINHRATGQEQSTFSIDEEKISDVKQKLQFKTVNLYEGWKTKPFEIHQVLTLADYYAIEASSPEVDDIIRLKDLYNRPGGRILTEHNQK